MGELELGVSSDSVREVLRLGRITPLPRAPAFLLGVTGHRGDVLPVIDLLRFFGKGEARPGPRTRIFVAGVGAYTSGVLVDAVIGLRRVKTQDILTAPIGGDVSAEHMLGVVPREGPGGVLSLINFSKLLQTARQRAVAR